MMKKMLKIPSHVLCATGQGQNYWLNGCLAYLMECLGESAEYDYWFFSGVTGDSFIQLYSKYPEEATLCYSHSFTERALENASRACGYSFERCVPCEAGRDECNARIRESIDAGIPVIARLDDVFGSFGVLCGYDETGFYSVSGEETLPRLCRYQEAIFTKARRSRPSLTEAYKNTILQIPSWLDMPETERFSFGEKAFEDWAYSFQRGTFAQYADDDPVFHTHPASAFCCWNMHGTYLCMLGTNACAMDFLKKAQKAGVYPKLIDRLLPLYKAQCVDSFSTLIEMEGGFSLQPYVLKDAQKMRPISDSILSAGAFCNAISETFHEYFRAYANVDDESR